MLHGWQASGPEHWQTWVARRLAEAGEQVAYPRLPDPDGPRLEDWLDALHTELEPSGQGTVVLCHSLGCWLWLHHAASARPEHRVDRVALVAPPSPAGRVPEVGAFPPPPLDAGGVAAAAGSTCVVFSHDDPYCPEGADAAIARPLGLSSVEVPGGAHLNTDAGYGPWPSLLAWCVGQAGTGAVGRFP